MQKQLNFRKNNTFYELLFQSIDECIIVVDSERKIVFLNQRTVELFGFSEKELLTQKIEKLIPKKHHKSHPTHVKEYSEKPEKKRMGTGRVLEAQTKSGAIINVEISLNHLDCEGEKFFVALITDVTRRTIAENQIIELNKKLEQKIEITSKELEQNQFLYTSVAQNFPNGIINVISKNYSYIFAQGKELKTLKINSEKLIGKSYLDYFPHKIKGEIKEKLETVFSGKELEFEIQKNNQFYHISAAPLINSEYNIDSALIVETNITEQKKASLKLEESLQKEKEINEMKSNFVSMASHEFRTPLSTIISSVSLINTYIEKGKLEGTKKHIKRIKNSVKGLTDILNDFLSSDKLESKKVEILHDYFNYFDFSKEITEELQALCQEGQQIIASIDNVPEIINTDQNIIKNILYNLVSNAIKYSPEHSKILFNSKVIDANLIIEIIDYGIGIPKNEQKELFNRFFRAKNVVNIKGTGLGLSIVKNYLDLIKGQISFESIENKETKFKITIPLNYD